MQVHLRQWDFCIVLVSIPGGHANIIVTYSEPRNHLSVPSRSESEAMASAYCPWIDESVMFVPYDGSTELKPVRGAGGGLRIASKALPPAVAVRKS
jgi:hypothetical protein